MSAYYPKHGGGIEIVAHQIARQLIKAEFDFTWCALGCDAVPENVPGLICNPLSGTNIVEKIAKIPFPLISPGSVLALWKLVKRSEIVHLHDYIYPSNFFSWLFAKIQKKPVVITQHIGLVPYKNPLFRLTFALVNHTLGRVMLSRSSLVVFIANHVQDYFAGICGSNKPHWRYIPNGVDSRVFNTSEIQAGRDPDLSSQLPQCQFVLFVGRFVEKKGLLFLKDLVRNCDDIQWVFAGQGPIDPQLWGLDNVTTIRHVGHECLSQLYNRARLLVLPSVGEGFPLVVQEAVACGTPVLTTPETSRGCYSADSFLVTLDIHSQTALGNWENGIRDLLEDKAKLYSISAEGALYAKENWNWNAISKQYEQAFSQAISRR